MGAQERQIQPEILKERGPALPAEETGGAALAHDLDARTEVLRDQLVGILSHDLRGPLAAITTGAALLAEMLPQVDILSLHLPLTPESHDLIDAAALALMKPSAVVVNTSRGGIVNEAALYQAISSGRLFGAGFDVFETEPPTADHPLMTLPTFGLCWASSG